MDNAPLTMPGRFRRRQSSPMVVEPGLIRGRREIGRDLCRAHGVRPALVIPRRPTASSQSPPRMPPSTTPSTSGSIARSSCRQAEYRPMCKIKCEEDSRPSDGVRDQRRQSLRGALHDHHLRGATRMARTDPRGGARGRHIAPADTCKRQDEPIRCLPRLSNGAASSSVDAVHRIAVVLLINTSFNEMCGFSAEAPIVKVGRPEEISRKALAATTGRRSTSIC